MHKIYPRLKSICVMAHANFDSWIHSPRTGIMLLFVVAVCYNVCTNHINTLQRNGVNVYWAETLYYIMSKGCNMTMTSILFLITISELPRQTGFQYDMLIRSTRGRWLNSQILYCLWMVLGMLFLLTVCVSLFILPGVSAGSGWSDEIRLAQGQITEDQALVPAFIRQNFSPLGACFYAMVPLLLFWLSMVLVVMLFSLLGMPTVGVLLYALMLVGNVVIMVEALGNIPMPIYYATLSNIVTGWPEEEFIRIKRTYLGYGIIILSLVVAMKARIKYAELRFDAERRF